MRVCILSLTLTSALLTILVACSPRTTQVPYTTPVSSTLATTPMSTPSLPTPRDSGWDKVVQAAKKEGSVTLYWYAGIGDVGLATKKAFENAYGIKLEIIAGPGTGFLERLKTERRMGYVVADLLQASLSNVLMAKDLGLTVSARGLPVFEEKDVWTIDPFSDKDGHLINLQIAEYTPWLNTRLVKSEDEPRSWQDFLQPKWKGQIIAGNPLNNSYTSLIALGLLEYGSIDEKLLKQLGGQLVMASTPRYAVETLSRGEAFFYFWGSGATEGPFVADKAPIRRLKIGEDLLVSATPFAMIDGPHPNAARLFTNWLMSQDGATAYFKAMAFKSIRKDVQDFQPEAAKITWATKNFMITADQLDRATKLFQDRWLVEMWKK